jgi:hypothetical protein
MFNKSVFVGEKNFERYQNAWYNNKKNVFICWESEIDMLNSCSWSMCCGPYWAINSTSGNYDSCVSGTADYHTFFF